VQYVVRPDQAFRGFAGLIESGMVRAGDRVVVLPSRIASSVRDILVAGDPRPAAHAGQSVVVTLADEIDAGRGHMIAHPEDMPAVDSHLEATLCWFSPEPVQAGRHYLLKHTTQTVRAFIDQVQYRLDPETQAHEPAYRLERNAIGSVLLTTSATLVFDPFARNRATGSFILVDEASGTTVGAGLMVRSGGARQALPDRPRRVSRGAVVWFTGLPASGKTTIATRVAERLSAPGVEVEHLDGDEFRKTFSRGLGFSDADRSENIERAARVAALLARHRVLVLATFVSPARAHRDIVKRAAADVCEVFVNAPVDVCMQRDPKGMYREARAGVRRDFTGVDAPYEEPSSPDLELRTDRMSVDEAADAVIALLDSRGILT
jgi:bifunctional enzyme CysN/CysC